MIFGLLFDFFNIKTVKGSGPPINTVSELFKKKDDVYCREHS